MIRRFAIAWSVVLVGAAVAVACRYTVRDIGFVDLRGAEYSLVVSGPPGAPQSRELQQRLANSNVASVVKLNREATTAGSDPSPDDRWQISLVDTHGRELELIELSRRSAEADLQTLIEDQLFSPTLDRLATRAADSFAHLVLIEGNDTAANESAWQVVRQATAELRRIEPLLPRPLSHPVRSLKVGHDQRDLERVLLWSLGVEAPEPGQPVLAVVYGRGQMAGKAMMGGDIALRETLAQLALVGESCECETDRDWLDERCLPLDWGPGLRQSAADALGFDPESPLVRAEVVRIVSRGPSSRSDGRTTELDGRDDADGRDDIEQLLLGYDESTLTPLPEESATPRDTDVVDSVEGVQATVVSGAGWDFETPPSSAKPVVVQPPSPSGASSESPAAVNPESAPVRNDYRDRSSGTLPMVLATLLVLAAVTLIAVIVLWGGSRA